MTVAILTILEFLFGSLMFSYWLGLLVRKDIRKVGDGNPGAFNLIKSAGFTVGFFGVLLDFMKGYLPLALFIHFFDIKGAALIPVAIAPILGHAFSPFLKFKGGKAMAVTFGVWSAVTLFEVSIVYAVILAILSVGIKIIRKGKPTASSTDSYMAVIGFSAVVVYLILRHFAMPIIILGALNLTVLLVVNRANLFLLIKRIWK